MESGIYITSNLNGIKDIQVQFGGKIGVAFACAKDCPKALVILSELSKKYKPGTDVLNKGEFHPENFNIKLIFNDVESINIFEKALREAKLHILTNLNKPCEIEQKEEA